MCITGGGSWCRSAGLSVHHDSRIRLHRDRKPVTGRTRSGNRRSWVVSLSPWADNPGSSEKHLNRLNNNSERLEFWASAWLGKVLRVPLSRFTSIYGSLQQLICPVYSETPCEVGAGCAPCQFDVDEIGCRSYASNVYPGWKIINFLWLFGKVISY